MNYAIERLDRRQRYASQNDTSSTSPSSSKNNGSLASDLTTAIQTLRIKSSPTICGEELSKAHTLAGTTLRDGGYVKQSVFHFGMSWIYSPNCPMRAADYAQMMDFVGYPEIGALSLLYFSCGGKLVSSVSESHDDNKIGDVMNIFILTPDELKYDADSSNSNNCGCGFSECGASNYFLPLRSS